MLVVPGCIVRLSWNEVTSRLLFPSFLFIEIRLRGVRMGERGGRAGLLFKSSLLGRYVIQSITCRRQMNCNNRCRTWPESSVITQQQGVL